MRYYWFRAWPSIPLSGACSFSGSAFRVPIFFKLPRRGNKSSTWHVNLKWKIRDNCDIRRDCFVLRSHTSCILQCALTGKKSSVISILGVRFFSLSLILNILSRPESRTRWALTRGFFLGTGRPRRVAEYDVRWYPQGWENVVYRLDWILFRFSNTWSSKFDLRTSS